MRTSTHPRTRRLRTLIIGTFLVPGPWLLASTSHTAAQEPKAGGKQAVVTVQGMQCPFCAYGIQKQLKKLPGAKSVEVELGQNQAIVTFEPDAKVTDADIQQAVRKAGFTPGKIEWRSGPRLEKEKTTNASPAQDTTATFDIEGMRCLGCEAKITADLEQLPGVRLAQVDWETRSATVRYDASQVTPEELVRRIERAGQFQARLKTSKE